MTEPAVVEGRALCRKLANLYLPLRGATYQRQGKGRWVLVAENQGFA